MIQTAKPGRSGLLIAECERGFAIHANRLNPKRRQKKEPYWLPHHPQVKYVGHPRAERALARFKITMEAKRERLALQR